MVTFSLDALIIRPGALGDTLMVVPALVYLRERASVTFVGRQPGLDYIADHVHGAMDLEGPGWHRLFMDQPDPKGLPVSRKDRVVAFFSDKEGKIRANLKACFPHTPVHVFPSFPPPGEKTHAARYLADRLKSAGLPVDPKAAVEKAVNSALLGDCGIPGHGKRIVLHPGSGDPKKNLPPPFWLNLLERLHKEDEFRDFTPTVLIGPAEDALRPFFREHLLSVRGELYSRPSKDPLTRLLSEAALYLGHDSGITHLAAMLGAPTVALFKSSDMDQWRPLGPQVRVLEAESEDLGLTEKVLEASKTPGRQYQPVNPAPAPSAVF